MTAALRRLLVTAGVAAAAGALGYAWRARRGDGSADEGDRHGLWSLRLPAPDGGTLDFAALHGRALLLNFWATWCPPCIKEMPQLDRFHTEFGPRGWQVVGLAADEPAAVRSFLARSPVRYPIAIAGARGIELSRRLGNADGALPFSVHFGADGGIRWRKRGETNFAELAVQAAKAG